jgi:hypothetical protein
MNVAIYGLFADNDGAQEVPVTDVTITLIVGIDDRVDTGLASNLSPLWSFAVERWRMDDSRCGGYNV